MKKNAFTVTVVAIAFAFIFIACGGEEPNLPDDDQDNDEIVVVDDEPDNEQPDDIVDEEPVDDDQLPLEEVCKNFLDYAGNWTIVDMDFTGDFKVTLSIEGEECKISVVGTTELAWTFAWKGKELPLECVEYAPATYFFYLVGMENDKMVWHKGWDEESCVDLEIGMTIKLKKK